MSMHLLRLGGDRLMLLMHVERGNDMTFEAAETPVVHATDSKFKDLQQSVPRLFCL